MRNASSERVSCDSRGRRPRDERSAPLAPAEPAAISSVASWFALGIFSRREFQVAEALRGEGVEAWLPTRTVETRWSDRTKLTTHPLFSGYLFARFAAREASRIRQTRGVFAILGLDHEPVPIPDAEIANLQRITASSAAAACPYVAGCTITVARGPFAGVSGVVTRTRGAAVLSIPIEILGRSVSVEIDAADVENK